MDLAIFATLAAPLCLAAFGGGMLFARFLIIRHPGQVGLRPLPEPNRSGHKDGEYRCQK